MQKAERIERFCECIWEWYSRNKRTLPWRDLQELSPSQKAYAIWISEVMLQQTQVSRVEYKWKEWLRTFPTIGALANASNKQVIMAWQGMGYNSRALRLRDTAKQIVEQYGQVFPQEYKELIALKGIGPYTAAAIRNFAFGLATACIDTNIHRILHRTFFGAEDKYGQWKRSNVQVLALAMQILPIALNKKCIQKYQSWFVSAPSAEWHAALMDFGSAICTKRNPKWPQDPLAIAGISKAAYKVPAQIAKPKAEPGRLIAGTFTPNRIVRGRIVQFLREAHTAQSVQNIGKNVCNDWSAVHTPWLTGLLLALEKDRLITQGITGYALRE